MCLAGAEQFRRLIRRNVRRVTVSHERRLYVTPFIDGLLNGGDPKRGFPDVVAQAFVDRFMAGHFMGVSLVGTSSDLVDIERLRNLDEVWVLCVRRPKPGWRLFGRFLAKDCFVALQAFDRHELGRRTNYERLAAATIDRWNEVFAGQPPHRGEAIADYLGGVLRDVDDRE